MPFFQHEETGGCVQTFFGNKPPSKRFYEITEEQYKMWLANQSKSLPTNTQQAKHEIKPACSTCVWHNSGSEACGDCKNYNWYIPA